MSDALHLDYETGSELNLPEVGLHSYATHPSTKVILAAYAFNNRAVRVWSPHREAMPSDLRDALEDPFVIKKAWNATFERAITKYVLGIDVPMSEWRDPMVNAKYLSMPGSLADVGAILGLKDDEQKSVEGKRLIHLFCEASVKSGGENLFGAVAAGYRDHTTDPVEWALFEDYVRRDVVSERAIDHKLCRFPVPEFEWDAWALDQRINERGIFVDMALVRGAKALADRDLLRLRAKLRDITGIENPNSNEQMLEWVRTQGYPFTSLGKPFVNRAMDGEGELTDLAKEVLQIRRMTSKTSVNKFDAILANVCSDHRIRHQFSFMGAPRTGRWSGKGGLGSGVQMQNLTKPSKAVEKSLDRALELVRKADYDTVIQEFGSPLDVASSVVRCSFIASPGTKLVICDLSAIEARVVAWISGCEGLLRVFHEGLDPYIDFATELFKKPYDQVTKQERTNSKPAVLGCFGENTLVLTHTGWKRIVEISLSDKLWDGCAWVGHSGVAYQGVKSVIDLLGVDVTPDHLILVGREWVQAQRVGESVSQQRVALKEDTPKFPEPRLLHRPNVARARTYDVLNAGPRSRFTILTSSGPMIVHNCCYQLGAGEVVVADDGVSTKTGLLGYADALGVKLTQQEAQEAVAVYREKYKEIPNFWYDLERASIAAVRGKGPQTVGVVTFDCVGTKVLRVLLPSGRHLHYLNPEVSKQEFTANGRTYEKSVLSYMGLDQQTRQWVRQNTRGGHLTENLCQAIARDILLHGMALAEERGFAVVAHVHDELVAEAPVGDTLGVEQLADCMRAVPAWAEGLPLDAAGFESMYYRKD